VCSVTFWSSKVSQVRPFYGIEFYENAHTLTTNPGGQVPICLLIHLVKQIEKRNFLLNRRQVHILHAILCTFIEWQNDEEDQDHETPCHSIFHSLQTETLIIDALKALFYNVAI